LSAIPIFLHFQHKSWGANQFGWVLQSDNRIQPNEGQERGAELTGLQHYTDLYSLNAISQYGRYCTHVVSDNQVE